MRSMRARRLLRGAAIIFVAGAARTASAQLRVGTRAPEIDLKTFAGERVKLSGFRGKPVVLTIWATWCPSCRAEFPELSALYRRLHKDGLEALAVNERDQETSDADVQKFLAEYAPPFPVVIDTRGSSRRAYELIGLPTTVFIDSAGVIRGFHSGPLRAEELRAGVALILQAK